MGARIFVILVLPFSITLTYLGTLAREIKDAFWFAQNAAKQDFAPGVDMWRRKSIRPASHTETH